MYVTGLLLYAAIISALVGYLGSGLAKSVISSTEVRISRKSRKPNYFVEVLLKADEMCTCFLRNLALTFKEKQGG